MVISLLFRPLFKFLKSVALSLNLNALNFMLYNLVESVARRNEDKTKNCLSIKLEN